VQLADLLAVVYKVLSRDARKNDVEDSMTRVDDKTIDI
jgi:hypothetical protein